MLTYTQKNNDTKCLFLTHKGADSFLTGSTVCVCVCVVRDLLCWAAVRYICFHPDDMGGSVYIKSYNHFWSMGRKIVLPEDTQPLWAPFPFRFRSLRSLLQSLLAATCSRLWLLLSDKQSSNNLTESLILPLEIHDFTVEFKTITKSASKPVLVWLFY